MGKAVGSKFLNNLDYASPKYFNLYRGKLFFALLFISPSGFLDLYALSSQIRIRFDFLPLYLKFFTGGVANKPILL